MSRIALFLTTLALLAIAAQAEFPPISPEEKAVTQVAGAPNARAVVLFRKAEFRMMDPASSDISSRLIVHERVKILTEQGKDRGEIQLFHSSFVRLFSLAARTVLADGRVVELAKDAKFERKLSKSRKYYVTSIAFPNVEVGAILDAEYELRFDNIFYLEPFYFSSDIPVRLAEIRYLIPGSLGVQTWMRDPFRIGVKTEQGRDVGKRTLRAWSENLPPILDEPYGLPLADLATQIMLVPTVFDEGTIHQRLMESWAATSDFLKETWDKARRRGGEAGKKAQILAQKAGAAPRDRAAAIYSFVRDEIAFDEDNTGIFLTGSEPSADAVLRAGHGTTAEKALLLETMLAAVKLDAKKVWAAPRSGGLIDAQVANPAWFDRVLVAIELEPKDGGRVYLDPTDRRLGFGRLDADYEGTAALLPDPKKPEGVVLAQTPAEQNVEKATVTLQVGAGGRLSGTGKLELSGLSATDKLRWRETPEKTTEAWHDWLVARFEGYDLTNLASKESIEDRTVELAWTMTQKEEDALGDEVTLAASRPLGRRRSRSRPLRRSAARRFCSTSPLPSRSILKSPGRKDGTSKSRPGPPRATARPVRSRLRSSSTIRRERRRSTARSPCARSSFQPAKSAISRVICSPRRPRAMLNPSSSSVARSVVGLAALTFAAILANPVHAATVLERSVVVEVRPDGSMRTTENLRVRLEAAEDFAAWSPYPVGYDENARIERLEARTIRPDGKVVEAGRKDVDTAEVSSAGVLHSGVKVRTVTFPAAPVGSILEVESATVEQPYFPGSLVDLSPGRDRITALSVEVRGAGPDFRFHISGPTASLQIEPTAGGVRVTGHDLPADRTLDSGPTDPGPTLRFAWGAASDWRGIAAWWAGLLRSVPRGAPEVRAEAERVVRTLSATATKQEKLAALARYAQRDVRYVAIEVGVGGYRPHSPAEAIGKKYGDCKDKAVLLVDLLAAADIEAYPVLIRLDRFGRIDREFPSPFDFNHAIVAIPIAGLDLPPGAPVAGGYLFVDATQEIGASLVWLSPHVQDQDALVVRGENGAGSVLVRTPTIPAGEARTLTIDLSISTSEPLSGDAEGQAKLDLSGWQAASMIETLADKQPYEIDATLRGIFADLFPGATLGRLTWKPEREGLPHATASIQVTLPGLLGNASRSFQATSLSATPSAGVLDDRITHPIPIVLSPGITKTLWRFRLPEAACKLEPQDTTTENALGSFRQTLRFEDGLAILERTAETHTRFVEPADFPAFKELSLAEHRAEKKRVRLGCGG